MVRAGAVSPVCQIFKGESETKQSFCCNFLIVYNNYRIKLYRKSRKNVKTTKKVIKSFNVSHLII